MKAIRVPIILTSLRTRVDKSLGISASLPELPPDEVVQLMEILNINLVALFEPTDFHITEAHQIEPVSRSKAKTPSQKIRHLLYLCFTRGIDTLEGENEEDYYLRYTTKIIDRLAAKLEAYSDSPERG